MTENFENWFDRLRSDTLDERDGIALLASLRDALRGSGARAAAVPGDRLDGARLPRFATPDWQARSYREERQVAPTFDAVLVVGEASLAADWREGLTAAFSPARILWIDTGAQPPEAAHEDPVPDAVAENARVAVLLIDDLAQDGTVGEADEPHRYLTRLLWAFALLRNLLARRIERCHLLHLTPLRHALPIAAAWHGLAKSVVLESPRFASGGVWLSDSDAARVTPELAARELSELMPARHRDIAWIDGRRCERVLVAHAHGAVAPTVGPLACGETVLITGGAGGLGLAIAERLTTDFALRVVLCGRRAAHALDDRQRDWLARHPTVRYVSADVSDPDQVRTLMAELGAATPLAAVFHAAGGSDDAPLRAKSLRAIRAVLAPKVLGTQWLDRHAIGLGVRYFVCFSSVASLAGSAGQADYASGNGFMDEYCRLRQAASDASGGCCYLSINWPYWREGGMRADPGRLERIAADSGLTSLGTVEGVDSLLALLARPAPQVAVLPGERARIDRAFLATQPPERPVARAEADDPASGLRELVARTLKMAPEAIDADTPFSEYGFDSILLTELASTIGRRYPGLELEVGVFLDHPTLRELNDWLRVRLAETSSDPDIARAARPDEVAPSQGDPLLDRLRALASTILKLPATDIDAETSWSTFGFDSISLNEFAVLIARDFRTGPLAADLFLSCATLAELAAHLAARVRATEPAHERAPARRVAVSALTNPGPVPDATEEIAIIGMAGRFPGASDLPDFWRNLVEDRHAVTEIPADRWRWQDYAAGAPGKTDCHYAAFLTAIDRFDAAHFSISPREAELMDPQQRLLLECAWEAFENAAIAPDSVRGRRIGLFFGAEKHDYLSLIADADVDIDPYINTGNAHAMLTNRVSYFFGLTGPSMTLNTACSSSMTAIHAAVASLRSGASEMALAGGVNILLSPGLFVLNRKMGMLTACDRIKPFDRDASGHLFGEGLGLVLLKPLRLALRDGDPVHGVIRAVDVTHGGHGRFLTAPHAPSHEALIRGVLHQAGASPADVDYLEAQGSGDASTDRMELETYHALYGDRAGGEPLPIGSVKGHIAHLGAASGVTALIKVLLCMSHDRLLPILHHRQINWPHDEPFAGRLLTAHAEWRPKWVDGCRVPRVAAVHNFGYGGVNGHLLVREYLRAPAVEARWPAVARLWVVSARTAAQLRQSVARLVAYLRDGGYRLHGQREPGVESIAFTLQTGRQPLNHRLALWIGDTFKVDGLRTALARLDAWLADGHGDAHLLTGVVTPASRVEPSPASDEAADDPLRIAARWISGAPINWTACYGDTRPARISLPVYPFAATRYWVASRKDGDGAAPQGGSTAPGAAPALAGVSSAARARPAAVLHPLLHRLIPADRALRFLSTFSGDEPFFRDHRVRSAAMLPGAAYCEMFIAAATLAMPESERCSAGFRLEHLVWTRPLVPSDGTADIAVTMEPAMTPARRAGIDGRDVFRLTVGDVRSNDAQPYAQAIVVPEQRDTMPVPPIVEVEQLAVYSRGTRIDGARLYRRFAELGFEYGPSHRCIDALFYDGDEVLARMRPYEPDTHGTGYLLAPGLLDSALQASIGFDPAALDANHDGHLDGRLSPLLPFALERLRCHRTSGLSEHVRWVRLRRRAGMAGNPVVKLDVDLLDADGHVCARLEGYSARRVKSEVAACAVPATRRDAAGTIPVPLPEPAVWRDEDGVRVYSCRFEPNDLYLRHHRIDGQALLPAVALLDLARVIADTLPRDEAAAALRISRATWQKPVFVGTPGRDAALRVAHRDGCWTATLESGNGMQGGVAPYAQCDLTWTADVPDADPLPDRARRAGAPLSKADVAQRFAGSLVRESGDVLGLPGGIRIIGCESSADTTWLTLACEDGNDDSAGGARSTAFGLLFAIVDLCGRDREAAGLAIPYGIDECLLYRAFPRQVRVEIRAASPGTSARTRVYDIRIADLEHRPVMQITRLTMVAPREAAAGPAASPTALTDDATLALQQCLREWVGELQKIDPDEIGLDDDLATFGLDSFSFTALSSRLNDRFAIDTMPTVFFEHGTVRALANGLLRTYPNLAAGLRDDGRVTRRDEPGPGAISPVSASLPRGPAGTDAIAIVGMAIRLPRAKTLDAFRRRLITPHEEASGLEAAASNRADTDKNGADAATQADRVPPAWFGADVEEGASGRGLVSVLETVWHLFEDAGMAPATLRGSDTEVYLGVSSRATAESDLPVALPASHAFSNRISFEFDFHGPSQAIDTGCSSALAALARGAERLRQRRCGLVVVGGVNVIAPTCGGEARASDNMDGGIGMVLLKRLDDALRDGDRIHAVVAAVAENHGGRTLSLAAPSVEAQRELLIAAYRQAGVGAAGIGHIELHGAGTVVADTIECEALRDAFTELRGRQAVPREAPRCMLGAIGGRLGALGAAGGMAGVIKTALMLRHQTIAGHPPWLDTRLVDLEGSGLEAVGEAARPWPATHNAQPRCAGVSSFGATGANAHAVLLEHVAVPAHRPDGMSPPDSARLFLLSAHSETALRAQARALASHLARCASADDIMADARGQVLHDMAYTLQAGRDALPWRFGVVATTSDALQRQLRLFSDDPTEGCAALAEFRVAHVDPLRPDFSDDEDMQALVRQWLEKGKRMHVLRLWLDGVSIDWRAAYRTRPGALTDLPPYPFPSAVALHEAGTDCAVAAAQTPARAAGDLAVDVRIRRLLIGGPERHASIDGNSPADAEALMQRIRHVGELLGATLSVGDAYRYPNVDALRTALRDRERRAEAADGVAAAASGDPFARYYRMAFGEIDGFERALLELDDDVILDVLHNVSPGKPPLLLLAPMGCLGTAWLHQVREFAADYSIIVCHYPGHAASSGTAALLSAAGTLADVARLIWTALDRLGIGLPVHLVGWSMGGLVAECMTAVDPERVASMTLVNGLDAPGNGGLDRAMRELVHEVSTQVAPEVYRHFEGDHFAIKACYDASILDAYLRCASATTVKKDLAAPRFPVLVLAGGRDRVIPPEASRRLWERFDGAAFELLDEAGHYLPMTHADWFNERLRQHLEVTV
jgi:polyketide synthase PksN